MMSHRARRGRQLLNRRRPPNKERVSLTYSTQPLITALWRQRESALAALLMRRLLCSLTCPHAFLPHHFTAPKNKRRESAAYNYPRTCATQPAWVPRSHFYSPQSLSPTIKHRRATLHVITWHLKTQYFSLPHRKGKSLMCSYGGIAMKCQDMNKNDVSRSGEESVSTGNHQSRKLWYGWALMNSRINAEKRCGKGSEAWTCNASPAFISQRRKRGDLDVSWFTKRGKNLKGQS